MILTARTKSTGISDLVRATSIMFSLVFGLQVETIPHSLGKWQCHESGLIRCLQHDSFSVAFPPFCAGTKESSQRLSVSAVKHLLHKDYETAQMRRMSTGRRYEGMGNVPTGSIFPFAHEIYNVMQTNIVLHNRRTNKMWRDF